MNKWVKENKVASFLIAMTIGLIALRQADPVKYNQFIDIIWDSFLYVARSAKAVWEDLSKK